ncbi:NAD(P)-dependent oxidoreductase [Desulfosporosinus sp. PR]|uniref:NAD-dependent epimerase/dehydratase family protein n=1 Tax=Candidatus Desulfosporosinus nitrosoreducens TaxID=3401928 RepID=UPI0027EB6723|nr:NAD(P)-dependent oxidoreductase [Desulfosporosinus sp. PR]MDQ7096253.1 NAD(P)-dependent oxidoreductase [Desulfosporosinus sp. PR]
MNKIRQVALISGAGGFIGSHLSKRLVSSGWEVHIIAREGSDLSEVRKLTDDRITIHVHNEIISNMMDIVAKSKPMVVFHLASLFLPQHQYEDIAKLVESNILFGTQLIDAMVKNGVYRLINTGTSWQHYQNEAYNPVCLYAATKQAFESMLIYYQKTTPLKVITLKLFDTYGPNDKRKKLFSLLKDSINTNVPLLMSEGEQYIDLVYIDDVIEAFIISLKHLFSNHSKYLRDYAVTSGNPIKLKDLVLLIEKALGKKINIIWGGKPYRDREVMMPWNVGQQLPEWEAKVKLVDGISKIIRYD